MVEYKSWWPRNNLYVAAAALAAVIGLGMYYHDRQLQKIEYKFQPIERKLSGVMNDLDDVLDKTEKTNLQLENQLNALEADIREIKQLNVDLKLLSQGN